MAFSPPMTAFQRFFCCGHIALTQLPREGRINAVENRVPEVLTLQLLFGLLIPPGYADGMTYSKHTREICQQMMAETQRPKTGSP